MRHVGRIPHLILGLSVISCDAHDYWMMPDPIEVDSDAGIYVAKNKDSISQDLFLRYKLDYQIDNLSSDKETEVVVSATSFVNKVTRATGLKVWHLAAGECKTGELTPALISYGNSLEVTLSCCATSRCESKDVSCDYFEAHDGGYDIDDADVMSFCYSSCNTLQDCASQCPSQEACDQVCLGSKTPEKCRTASCSADSGLPRCADSCKDNECLSACQTEDSCVSGCASSMATCYKNCLATAYICANISYNSESEWIPCALCGGNGNCFVDMDAQGERKLTSSTGIVYGCDIDCSVYPSVCVTGCLDIYESDGDRQTCMNSCLKQFLYWCNDNQASDDYVDTKVRQPCCYSDYCKNSLIGVVKSYRADCFNDTNCGSGRYCSDEGVCVSSGSSSCAASPKSSDRQKSAYLIAGAMLFFAGFARRLRMRLCRRKAA